MSLGSISLSEMDSSLTMDPEQHRRAAEVVRRFSDKYMPKLNLSNIRATLDEEDEGDNLWLESCSFDIMLQLLYVSYGEMLRRIRHMKGNSDDTNMSSIFASVGNNDERDEGHIATILAPETMALISNNDTTKKAKRKFVPETSFLFEDNNVEVAQNLGKKKSQTKPEAKRLKEGSSKKGKSDSTAIDDSPSLLKTCRKKDEIFPSESRDNVEEDDDFVEYVKSKSVPVPKNRSPQKATTSSSAKAASNILQRKVKVTNKFGIEMDDEWSMSQKQRVQNMKQGKINQFLGGKKEKALDEDLERARVESLKTYAKEKRSRSPLDASFDQLMSDEETADPKGKFKCQEPPVRTKEGRAALLGVDCPECRAFYEMDNLGTESLERVLQVCSKHRVPHKPMRSDSPQHPWSLDFRDDADMETQPVSPETGSLFYD